MHTGFMDAIPPAQGGREVQGDASNEGMASADVAVQAFASTSVNSHRNGSNLYPASGAKKTMPKPREQGRLVSL